MLSYEKIQQDLLMTYEKLHEENCPEWAVHKRNSEDFIKPTIPFVGKHYFEQEKKILVYASAENLAAYWKGNTKHWLGDWLDDDSQAENRHRKCFDDSSSKADQFFPYVHIGPMNNGCLATAAYYIATKLRRTENSSPRDFYESVAFGNFCKYSIETDWQRNIRTKVGATGKKENRDYTQFKVREAREKIEVSIPFLKADIEILEPDVIIVPKTLYDICKTSFDNARGETEIIPIYQINTRVINGIIATRYSCYDIDRLPVSIKTWYEQLRKEGMIGKTKENYLSVFTYLDQTLKHNGKLD